MSDSNFIQQLAQKLRMLGAMHAVGETWISFDGTVPAGGVPCCGQTVSRTLYADLLAWAQAKGKVKTETEWQSTAESQNGNCIYFGEGDGSTTFRMPKLTGYFKGSASSSEAGKWIEEGLPNIEATWLSAFEDAKLSENTSSGAVTSTLTQDTTLEIPNVSGPKCMRRECSAQHDNPIYGNSEHVTPETNTILVGVYAVSVLTNSGTADIADLQSALATLETEVSSGLSSKLSAESGGGRTTGGFNFRTACLFSAEQLQKLHRIKKSRLRFQKHSQTLALSTSR